MLKVESLKMNETLCHRDPEVKRGTAELMLKPDSNPANVIKLTGNFHLENCANGVVACVGLIGTADDLVKEITADKTELKLMGKVVRKVVIPDDVTTSTVFDIENLIADKDAFMALSTEEKAKLVKRGSATISAVNAVGTKTELTLSSAKKGILVVELPVEVASGKLENALAPADAQHVLEAGECHIDAVVRVADMPNLKPARTSWTVEGAQLRLAKKLEVV